MSLYLSHLKTYFKNCFRGKKLFCFGVKKEAKDYYPRFTGQQNAIELRWNDHRFFCISWMDNWHFLFRIFLTEATPYDTRKMATSLKPSSMSTWGRVSTKPAIFTFEMHLNHLFTLADAFVTLYLFLLSKSRLKSTSSGSKLSLRVKDDDDVL